MVACKVFLAVAVASIALVHVNGAPADTDWSIPFENAVKNITSKISEIVSTDSVSEYGNLAKNSLNSFADKFKNEISELSKKFESNPSVSDVVKEATKQWENVIETYAKNAPEELSVQKLNEKFENIMKHIAQQATSITKKSNGNSEVENNIREFTKKQIDSLVDNLKAVQSKLAEKKVQN